VHRLLLHCRGRAGTCTLLAALAGSLILAAPALGSVLREVRDVSPMWLAAAVALEVGSCVSYVVVFRRFFDRVPGRDARALAWTSMASSVLLPGGGIAGLAVGGWLIRLTGVPSRWIVCRSSALFFSTNAVSACAVLGASLLLLAGSAGPHDFLRAVLPALVAVIAIAAFAAVPRVRRRGGDLSPWLEGLQEAERAMRSPSWRMLGAIGYLGFDVAVLWAALSAVGHAPPAPALVLGYSVGYLAAAVPIPGGVGALDAGLAGALALYGAPVAELAAAVLIYRAIALWIPAGGGLLAYARLRRRLAPNPAARGPIAAAEPA
jgi:uncharacterized membrane protein YbhN (UPF0104 family)